MDDDLPDEALFNTWRRTRRWICIFFREREPGWYRWSRDWGTEATYELITSGQVAIRHSPDEDEKISVLPPDWEERGYGIDDDIMIMDSFFMEQQEM